MRVYSIAENQPVDAVLVLEEIIDPLMLHQPVNEVEIGLPVLHAVIPERMSATESSRPVRQLVLVKNFLDDFDDALVLENPAVSGPGQKPQERNQGQLIPVKILIGTAQTGMGNL